MALLADALINTSVIVLVADATALDELPVTLPEITEELHEYVDPGMELLICRLVALPVQMVAAAFVMVTTGLGLTVTV